MTRAQAIAAKAAAFAIAAGLAGCHGKKHEPAAKPIAAAPASAATPVPVEEPVSAWGWVTAAQSQVHATPSGGAIGELAHGERVAVRGREAIGGVVWDRIREGWVRESELSPSRVSAPVAASAPPRVVAHKSPNTAHPARVDARAFAESNPGTPSAHDPADDLATLQLAVDELYLDPKTWQPSPERRQKDAAEFRKGIE